MCKISLVFFMMVIGVWSAAAQLPPLTVTIEPEEAGSVVYSPAAARSTAHQTTGQIAILLRIENTGILPAVIETVTIIYSGPGGSVTQKEIARKDDASLPLTINGGMVGYWHQVRNNTEDTVIYLTENFEPNLISVKLTCKGFPKPVIISRPMKKHSSLADGGSYRFPGRARDMSDGEYWSTASSHGTSTYGSQLFGYDMGVTGWDEQEKKYKDTLPGKSGCKNTDYRVYGKPVYSMAAGEVIKFKNDAIENPMPFRLAGDTNTNCPTEQEKKDWTCTLPAGTGGGNYVMIRTRDEVHEYGHLQTGTVNERLKVGENVNAGVYLGRVGNTGCSTAPHIHFDMLQIHDLAQLKIDSNQNHPDIVSLRPLLFHDIYTIDASLLTGRDPHPDKWSKVVDRAIPRQFSYIWGSKSEPCYHVPEMPEISYYEIPSDEFQAKLSRAETCGYYPEWVDGFEYKGRNYYNVIFRYDPTRAWRSRHKQDLAEFNAHRQELESAGYRLIFVDSYPGDGKTWFSTIYVRDGGPQTKVTPLMPDPAHNVQFTELTENGWRPIRVSSVAGAVTFITTLYEKRPVGKWEMRHALTSAEYKTLFQKNLDKGWELVHLNAYIAGDGKERFGAIWHQNTPYSVVSGRHGLSALDYRLQLDTHLKKDYLTRVITGYEVNDAILFAAAWGK